MISKTSLTLALLSLLVACGQEQQAVSEAVTGAAGFEQALEAARAAQAQAAKAGNQWTTGQPLIDRAVELASEGKEDQAMPLLQDARAMYELAARQAEREAKDWQARVIR